jgi:hypothetical protein
MSGIVEAEIVDTSPFYCAANGHRHLPRSEREKSVIAELGRNRAKRLDGSIVEIDVARVAVLGVGECNHTVFPID